jgi:Uma2 family endonuclease
VVGELFGRLYHYLAEHGAGMHVVLSPADIRWSGDVLVQPDVFVVRSEELTAQDWSSVHTLLLAIEVVSPSSARHDRVTKRRLYQRQRVATYWVVDPDARVVEVWRPDDDRPEIVTDVLWWQAIPGTRSLELPLAQIFRAP